VTGQLGWRSRSRWASLLSSCFDFLFWPCLVFLLSFAVGTNFEFYDWDKQALFHYQKFCQSLQCRSSCLLILYFCHLWAGLWFLQRVSRSLIFANLTGLALQGQGPSFRYLSCHQFTHLCRPKRTNSVCVLSSHAIIFNCTLSQF